MKYIFLILFAANAFFLQAQVKPSDYRVGKKVNLATQKGRFRLSFQNYPANILVHGAPNNVFGVYFGRIKFDNVFGDADSKLFIFGLSGSGHYFIANNFSLGLKLGFSHFKIDEDLSESKLTVFNAGPEAAYFIPVKDRVFFFLKGSAEFGSLKEDGEDDAIKLSRYTGASGFAIFPTPNFSVDLGINYSSSIRNYEGDFKEKDNLFGILVGFSLFF